MAKIRDDYEGVLYVGGLVLEAGDKIPAGVRVGGHLTDSGKDVGPEPDQNAAPAVAPAEVQDPLNDADSALAAELGPAHSRSRPMSPTVSSSSQPPTACSRNSAERTYWSTTPASCSSAHSRPPNATTTAT